jgi:hypothetical protein
MWIIAEFTNPVDSVTIFGAEDSFFVRAYDEQHELIDTFSSPDPFPPEGFLLEISPDDTGNKSIKWIEFGGSEAHFTYFDDLTVQRH